MVAFVGALHVEVTTYRAWNVTMLKVLAELSSGGRGSVGRKGLPLGRHKCWITSRWVRATWRAAAASTMQRFDPWASSAPWIFRDVARTTEPCPGSFVSSLRSRA